MGFFWKNAILLTKRGTRSGAARLGSYCTDGELTINGELDVLAENEQALPQLAGVICRLRPARSEKVGN